LKKEPLVSKANAVV